MSKHTKGPWIIKDEYGIQIVSMTAHPEKLEFIAKDVCNLNDAQLIAAAPELLEALQYAEKYIRMAVSEGALVNCALPVSNIQRMILGVLKKAQGEE